VAPPRISSRELALAILSSPRLSSALTTVSITAALCAFALRQLTGWPGFLAIVVGLIALSMLSLIAQWKNIGWRALVPLSLVAFVGWAALSVFWSQYQWATLGSLAYLAAFTVLAIYIALVRDTIQIVRAFGDALRAVLLVSIGLEVFAGLLIDSAIPLLQIAGNLDSGGPIQGLAGTRNQLGVISVIALITFATEARTKSVPRQRAIGSLILATITLLASRSPVAFGIVILVGLAAAILYALRRVPSGRRRYWQVVAFVSMAIVAVTAWTFRGPVISALNAEGELDYRLNVWQQVWSLIPLNSLEGWGWIGIWRSSLAPFTAFSAHPNRVPGSAYNAYLDVWFQLGLVGLVIFVGFLGLAFVRSWLLASRRRSVVFAWPALVLAALLISGLAESSILVEFGWMTVVVCSVKAARELSWRTAFDATRRPVDPIDESEPAEI
jgi:O-antigen ligase